MTDYQPMPALTPDEYDALKADIAEHGVLVPIEVDESGNVLDGYHRQRACDELGISPPVVVRAGLTEQQKHEHALRLNLARRHLSTAQKRELISAELDRDPARSDRAISRLLGVDHKTVGAVRRGEFTQSYDRVVAAARAEVAAIHRFAVELADLVMSLSPSSSEAIDFLDRVGMPPENLDELLAEVAGAIEQAGGEPRSVAELRALLHA